MSVKKVFLIDGHALCYRSFYGITGLTNSKGQATNAVYGFVSTLRKIQKEFSPTHMAVCFDTGKKTIRQEKFKEYKIQRPSMPEDLISQLPIIKEVLKAYRIPAFELDGYEADDLIATIVKHLKSSGPQIVIATDDKDMFQLIEDQVLIYSFRQDKLLGAAESKERFGIAPTFITDYLGLCGDTSDNIPGVKGIGEVTARNLIEQFGGLENIYNHIDEIKQAKVKEKLIEQKEMALVSKTLAVLDSDVPVELDMERLAVLAPDQEQLGALFNELEFRKFAAEYASETSTQTAAQEALLTGCKPSELIDVINKTKKVSVLFDPKFVENDESVFFLSSKDKVTRISASELKLFSQILENAEVRKTVYDSKVLRKTLLRLGMDLQGIEFDALLAGYLLLSGQSSLDLPTLVWSFLKESVSEDDRLRQALALEKLSDVMRADLKEKQLWQLYDELELPLSIVLSEMEKEGVNIDVQALLKLSQDLDAKMKQMTAHIYSLAGAEFNLNSPKQLSEVLFVKLKLPVIKKTKTGFSTDEEVLSRLAAKHDIAQVILDYRQISKLKSTYIDALPKLVDEHTHRLHATFNQAGAETGRLSSNNPNLQNIPIRTELGREVRRAFVPFTAKDLLMSADYSQIELRILAHLSGDEGLIKAFNDGQDIHAYTAGLIFDVAEKDVDAKMRNAAKRVNFGIIYGISAFGLAKDLGVSNPEAQDFIDRYFLRYPKVKSFMDQEIKKAQDQGYVTTIFHRRRYIPEINSKNIGLRQFAERQAINTPVQGSAADLMKKAMIRMHELIKKSGLKSRMIITVHDELVFNVPQMEKDKMASLVREAMEQVYTFSVPITITVKVGKNWLEMEKI